MLHTLIAIFIVFLVSNVSAQDSKARAEAGGKLMLYATFTAADSKTLLDAFKQVYPKIDAQYYRTNDAALMERFVSETITLDQVEDAFAAMHRGDVLRSVVVF